MKKSLPYILITIVLLIAAGIYLDRSKKSGGDNISLIGALKNDPMNKVDLKSYGPAPEFTGIEKWLNSEPLTMRQLKGKVVLIDFWTYSCINCVRTLPYVTGWYEKYKDKGLVVVGVHTPEFAFEKDTTNVQTALKRHNINYPVAQDNDFGTWQAYNNRFWPAHYLIDQNGQIVYEHFGEGKYQETEQAIQQLIGLGEEKEMAENERLRDVQTPEIYFGLKRLSLLSEDQKASQTVQQYNFPSGLHTNYFALDGQWSFNEESSKLASNFGKIKLNFFAEDVHMVAKSSNGVNVKVFVDGQFNRAVNVKDSSLYTLFEGESSKPRILELQIEGADFEAFTFTFG